MGFIKKYINAKFMDKGRGPDYYDCWGLVWRILVDEFGYDIPSYDDKYMSLKDCHIKELIDQESLKWIKIDCNNAKYGDVVYCRFKKFSEILNQIIEIGHVGLIVRPGQMIHIMEEVDVHVERYDSRQWRNKIIGIYRWKC